MFEIKTSMTLGGVTYQMSSQGEKEIDVLHKAIVLANPRSECDACGNGQDKMRLDSNKDGEGNVYVNTVCSCGAKSKLGQYKAGGFFWREFERYVKPE